VKPYDAIKDWKKTERVSDNNESAELLGSSFITEQADHFPNALNQTAGIYSFRVRNIKH
jgi:hypothetical protein